MEKKWTADEKFIFEGTGVYSITGGRNYYKKNKGKAIVAVLHGKNFTYPCLISTNPDYVINTCSYNTGNIGKYKHTIEYMGMTWYFAVGMYGWTERQSSSGYAPRIDCPTLVYTQYQKMMELMLKTANVRPAYSQRISEDVKNTILNNQLIRTYCTTATTIEEE